MIRKIIVRFIVSIFCILCISLSYKLPAYAEERKDAVNEVKDIIDGIISFNTLNSNIQDIQEYINSVLPGKIGGTAEWYALGLIQYGNYDFSKYKNELDKYLEENDVKGASARLKFSLILSFLGSDSDFIDTVLTDGSIGGQGIMSYVFGLHMLNNGHNGNVSGKEIVDILAGMQHEDGGWSVMGDYGDVDVTAMVLQSLAPYSKADAHNDISIGQISQMIENGVAFLSGKQEEDGVFSGFGVRNAESTAQVIAALSSLNIDCDSDPRFNKNGNTPIDGILKFRLDEGSFSHKENAESNPSATVQTFYSMVAYLRMREGLTPLYIRDKNEKKPEDFRNSKEIEDQNDLTDQDKTDQNTTDKNIIYQNATDQSKTDQNLTNSIQDSKTENAGINNGPGYKLYAVLGVVGLCLLVSAALMILKKHWKNYLFIGILGIAGIIFVLVTDFSSPSEYYGQSIEKVNVSGQVSMSIRCDILKDKGENEHIPKDYCILDKTEFELEEGETAYDILLQAAKKYGISVEHEGNSDIVYISGINYLYENDYGDLSGWVYKVNGKLPSVGCGGYELKDGDIIEWCYTLDLGNDVS